MINYIFHIFSHPFMIRALIVGLLVALCGALLGVNLVLKRCSMIGDGLSHVAFGAMAVAAALNFAPLVLAVPVVLIAAFFLMGVKENGKIKGDSAIAIITSSSLAIGVMVATFSKGMNTELMNYMFGSILSLSNFDTVFGIVLSVVVVSLYIIFYRGIFAVTFDESFAKATGVNVDAYRIMNSILTSVVVVLGMRMMGTLLISALLVFPPLSAMRVMKNYKGVVIVSAIISVVCFLAGLMVSSLFSTPVGATVVVANLVVFIIMGIVSFFKK